MKKSIITTMLSLFVSFTFAQYNLMLKELNPPKIDITRYDQATALYFAQLSEVAYWSDDQIKELVDSLNKIHPSNKVNYKLIEDVQGINNNQALVWGTNNFLVLAFRGTEPTVWKDWFSDAKIWVYENIPENNDTLANMPPGHGGFRKALMRLMRKGLFTEIEKIRLKCANGQNKSTFPVYLTGHSLGAAISQVCIEPINFKGYNFAGAYHFAPPLAVACSVNGEMKEKYGSKVYDIVNYKDYVPRAGRNDVAHFGNYYRICDNGLLYKETEAYVKFNIGEYRTETALHSLANHILLLRGAKNNIIDINKRSIGHFPCMELNGVPWDMCPELKK